MIITLVAANLVSASESAIAIKQVKEECRPGNYDGTQIERRGDGCAQIIAARIEDLLKAADLAQQGAITKDSCKILSDELTALIPTFNNIMRLIGKHEALLDPVDYFFIDRCPKRYSAESS